ncbi:MBL fold metallo-hydrolase [Sediminivirga luteola]|uniref:MBL fold metallo-hydrolase n=1 Tax=Sediminivirga luteola TaxID=1774748 RepID=A0A8J2XLN1_9MICO|nr:MBL fold metallo-hydrolase [Sediminivirga luteola]GGA24076.1 MBL fold metallo-hydrolase [Sediminivirga luteola]
MSRPLRLVRAANPGPMTLEGTNTYVLLADDASTALLIDPGPALEDHRQAFLQATGGARIEGIVLTHHHADHSELLQTADDWAPGVPVYAADESFQRYAPAPGQGQELVFGPGPGDQVVFELTPGHTRDSLCLLWRDVLFAGDTILGRGTTVVTYPEGTLAGYLASLDRLIGLADSGRFTAIAPGHGPWIDAPLEVLHHYRSHRLERLDQVRAALDAGAENAEDIVRQVYAGLGEDLVPAAVQSVRAQLEYLRQQG